MKKRNKFETKAVLVAALAIALALCATSVAAQKIDVTAFALSIATPLSAADEAVWKTVDAKSSNPKKVVWRHGNVVGNMLDSPAVRGDRQFFIEMKRRLGDKVEFQVYYNGSLGTSADQILGGLQSKNFESYSYNVGAFAEYTKAFMPLDVMFLVPNLEAGVAIVSGPPGKLMNEKCIKDTGLSVLFMGAIGMRHITNSRRPINTVEDIKGLKIRTQNNPLHILAVNKLGAAATPIAYAELFTSLQQKVVDGQENPISNIFAQNFAEVQKYLTFTNHLYTAGALVVNNEWIRSQSAEFQKAVAESSAIAQAYSGPELKKTEAKMIDKLKERMVMNELSKAEFEKFRKLSTDTWNEAAKKIGVDYFNSIKDSIAKMGY
jgi:tripartite ATP-independent transporter DctP family solute receptor